MDRDVINDGAPSEVRFSIIDWLVFVIMLVVSMGIGVVSAIRARKKESTNDYLVGGRAITPIAVGLSLLGGVVSAIAILGFASESYFYGMQFSAAGIGMAIGGLMVYHITLPVLYNLRLVSMSQYLELRFGCTFVRRLASVCQIISMVMLMAVVQYAPALALSTVTNLSPWASVLIMGSVCTIYTTIGGVRGVVYTDVLQTTLMYLGVLLIVITGSIKVGGAYQVWTIAQQGGRTQFFELDPDPFIRHSLWSTMAMGLYLSLFFFGINQASHQRFSSVASITLAKRLCILAISGIIVLLALCTAAGIVAYAVYSNCDPLAVGAIKKQDQILAYLVAESFGHLKGIPGIFVAAVYGGVLSSVSSCCNSLACMVWDDFLYPRQYFRNMNDTKATAVLKILSLVFGVIGVILAVGAGSLGNILQLANSLIGAVNSPLIGLYLTGMLAPWVNNKSAVVGFSTSLVINVWFLVGNIMRKKASPPTLPLSITNCYNFTTTTTTTPTPAVPVELVVSEGHSIYDLSYCYIGVTGIIITILISSIVSACIGMLSPWDHEKGVIHPIGAWTHGKLWQLTRGRKAGVVYINSTPSYSGDSRLDYHNKTKNIQENSQVKYSSQENSQVKDRQENS